MYDFVLLLTGSAQQWSGFPNEVASQQAVDQLSSNSVTFDLNFPAIWSHSWHNPMNFGMDYNTPALQCIAAWLCKFIVLSLTQWLWQLVIGLREKCVRVVNVISPLIKRLDTLAIIQCVNHHYNFPQSTAPTFVGRKQLPSVPKLKTTIISSDVKFRGK